MNYLSLIGRETELFEEDILVNSTKIASIISNSRFLVIGGSGSIGHAVTREIFKRDPKVLHVVDISENICKHGMLDKVYPKLIDWYKNSYNKGFCSNDRIHLNATGHSALAKLFLKTIPKK